MSKLLFVAMIPVLLISCTHKIDKNVMLFKALNDQLIYSSAEIGKSTDIELRSLAAKVQDPMTHDKAAIWYPNATQIKLYSDSIVEYIDTLKMILIQNSDFNTTDSIYREDNEDAPALVFETNGKAAELQEKLDKYTTAILSVDSGMAKEFGYISYDFERDPVSKEEQYFNHSYTIAAIAILNRLENKIRIIEKNMIKYCNDKINFTDGPGFFDKTAALVSQSSTEVTRVRKLR
jgi:hypothetical protein